MEPSSNADAFFGEFDSVDTRELLTEDQQKPKGPRGTNIKKYFKTFDRTLGNPQRNSFRKFVWGIFSLKASKYGSLTTYWPAKLFEFVIVFLIALNVCLAIVKTDPSIAGTDSFNSAYSTIVVISFLIFSAEYALRCWSCVEDSKYPGACSGRVVWITRPLSILDLVVLIAFMLDAIASFDSASSDAEYNRGSVSFLRLLRMLTILRIERQSKGLKRLGTVLKRKVPELLITIFVASILLCVSATLIYYVEPETFTSIPQGIWWATQTLTTVGYGDIYPESMAGRIIGVFVSFLGVCLFALPAGVLGSGLMEIVAEKRHAQAIAKMRKRAILRKKQRNTRVGKDNVGMASAPSIAGLDPHTSSDDTHGMDDAPPKFSEIFDIDNLEHMKYAASLFCGDTYGHVDSMEWNKYTPEDGGIVGLHAIIANRLSIEYLNDFFMRESTKRIRNSSADSMLLDNNFSFSDSLGKHLSTGGGDIELSNRNGEGQTTNITDKGTYIQL